MKIYTKVVIDIDSNKVVECDAFEYTGPLAECISFGGGGGGGESKPEKVKIWTPSQEEAFEAYMGRLGEAMRQPVPAYPGQLSIPRTPEEEAYFGRQSDYMQNIGRERDTLARQLAESKARVSQPAFSITPETTQQFYEQSIRDPAMQDWREIVEPQIRESFVGPGYWGSARAEAQQKGSEHLATTLGSQRAELYYKDEMARREAAEAAAAREAGYAPHEVQAAGLGMHYGALGEQFAEERAKSAAEYSRQIEQDKVTADLSRWLMGETVDGVTPLQYSPYTQILFQALGLSPWVVATKSKEWQGQGSFGIG